MSSGSFLGDALPGGGCGDGLSMRRHANRPGRRVLSAADGDYHDILRVQIAPGADVNTVLGWLLIGALLPTPSLLRGAHQERGGHWAAGQADDEASGCDEDGVIA